MTVLFLKTAILATLVPCGDTTKGACPIRSHMTGLAPSILWQNVPKVSSDTEWPWLVALAFHERLPSPFRTTEAGDNCCPSASKFWAFTVAEKEHFCSVPLAYLGGSGESLPQVPHLRGCRVTPLPGNQRSCICLEAQEGWARPPQASDGLPLP